MAKLVHCVCIYWTLILVSTSVSTSLICWKGQDCVTCIDKGCLFIMKEDGRSTCVENVLETHGRFDLIIRDEVDCLNNDDYSDSISSPTDFSKFRADGDFPLSPDRITHLAPPTSSVKSQVTTDANLKPVLHSTSIKPHVVTVANLKPVLHSKYLKSVLHSVPERQNSSNTTWSVTPVTKIIGESSHPVRSASDAIQSTNALNRIPATLTTGIVPLEPSSYQIQLEPINNADSVRTSPVTAATPALPLKTIDLPVLASSLSAKHLQSLTSTQQSGSVTMTQTNPTFFTLEYPPLHESAFSSYFPSETTLVSQLIHQNPTHSLSVLTRFGPEESWQSRHYQSDTESPSNSDLVSYKVTPVPQLTPVTLPVYITPSFVIAEAAQRHVTSTTNLVASESVTTDTHSSDDFAHSFTKDVYAKLSAVNTQYPVDNLQSSSASLGYEIEASVSSEYSGASSRTLTPSTHSESDITLPSTKAKTIVVSTSFIAATIILIMFILGYLALRPVVNEDTEFERTEGIEMTSIVPRSPAAAAESIV